MIAQVVEPSTDPCILSERWIIAPELAEKIVRMSASLPFGISMISGFRTKAEQDQLRKDGRPAADDRLSTHRSCPATGADLRVSVAVTDAVKATFGQAAVSAGLRWGGGSPVDPQTGIPSDWNHVDLGPRQR